ncbi:MAG: hypothetical protein LBF95_04735 [Treponema sp.]|jgi:hypothetical protein|nr:hypothetical protein [Treponema sp.]
MKKTMFGVITVMAALALVTCATNDGAQPVSTGAEVTTPRQAASADIKWDNDPAGFLTVNNNMNDPLVLFAGTIVNSHILGGVRALDSRRIDSFDRMEDPSGTFLLRAVKEDVYRSKGSNLNSDDIVFAGLVVYDSANARAIQVNINRVLGGEAYVIIQNDTNMALQIRIDRPDGPTLTTLAPLERNKKVYMDPNPDGYFFFPVYEYYDRSSMGIRSITARDLADGIPMMPVVPGPGRDSPVINFNSKPADLFSPFATLIVTNETNRGAYLLEGSSRKTNQNGTTMINPGSETYELNLQKQRALVIGGLNVDLSLGAANIINIPEYTYEAGNNYQIRIRQGAVPEVVPLGASDNDDFSIQLVNER